jgi:AraC-like DNA-binding protein
MDDHSFPGSYVLYSAELVKRWDVSADELLEGLGLDVATLGEPTSRVPLAVIVAVLERAKTLTQEPAYGYYLGMQIRVSAHGLLGLIAQSAPTLREAIEMGARFLAPVITTAISIRLEVERDEAYVILEEEADFGAARSSLVVAALIAIWQLGLGITGRPLNGRADLALPKPPNYETIELVAQDRLRFEQPRHRLVFDAAVLDARPTMADPVALRLARERCERILASRGPSASVTERIRSLVLHAPDIPVSLDRAARFFGVSARTLKRLLAAEGTTFSAIAEEERREQAMLRLRSSDKPVTEIAESLGFANSANFIRAFRRWTGRTPSEYRSERDPVSPKLA